MKRKSGSFSVFSVCFKCINVCVCACVCMCQLILSSRSNHFPDDAPLATDTQKHPCVR